MAASFDLAANGLLPETFPQLPTASSIHTVPPSLLKSVGWVESHWHQFTPGGLPLVSFDFGYGIMQITSGMAGAYGKVAGDLDPATQNEVATNYVYNIAFGASALAAKWSAVPRIGNGDPTVVENWYYALWAYNGWGWFNNPNNPRFTRQGTPESSPTTFPYQERVLYLVSHPPTDAAGNPLWQPVPITLPSRRKIGRNPGPLTLKVVHRQPPSPLSAVYRVAPLHPMPPGGNESVSVHVTNTGQQTWTSSGPSAVVLTYHLFSRKGNPWEPVSPFTPGVMAFGQDPVPLPHDLAPGKSLSLRMVVRAPRRAGSYRVAWDLQEGLASWFSQSGVLPHALPLRVSRSPVTATPYPTSTPTPSLQFDLRFIRDTGIPDGTRISIRKRFVKGWLVFNDGQNPWSAPAALHLVSGPSFGARVIPVQSTLSCHSANIIAHLKAPRKSGNYLSVWRMQDAEGHPFGDPLTIKVTVHGKATSASPVPTTTPVKTRTPVVPTPTPAG